MRILSLSLWETLEKCSRFRRLAVSLIFNERPNCGKLSKKVKPSILHTFRELCVLKKDSISNTVSWFRGMKFIHTLSKRRKQMDWNEDGFLKKRKPMGLWEREFVKISSIKLPDGGDTHFHQWKNKKRYGLDVTTRLPNPFSHGDPQRKYFPDDGNDFHDLIKIKPRDLPPPSDIIERRISRLHPLGKQPWELGPPPPPPPPPPIIGDPMMKPKPCCGLMGR